VLPIKFGTVASTKVAALGNQLGVPSDLHISLGLLIQFLQAETTPHQVESELQAWNSRIISQSNVKK